MDQSTTKITYEEAVRIATDLRFGLEDYKSERSNKSSYITITPEPFDGEYRRLIRHVEASAILRGVENGDDIEQFVNRIKINRSFVEEMWTTFNLESARELNNKNEIFLREESDRLTQIKWEKRISKIGAPHSIPRSLYESSSFIDDEIDSVDVQSLAYNYLSEPILHDDILEKFILDHLIFQDICRFAKQSTKTIELETVGKFSIAYIILGITGFLSNSVYSWIHKNILRMQIMHVISDIISWFFWSIVIFYTVINGTRIFYSTPFPSWSSISWHSIVSPTGDPVSFSILSLVAIQAIIHFLRKPRGETTIEMAFGIWNRMVIAYRLLSPLHSSSRLRIFSPTRLREELSKAEKNVPVWDDLVWVFVDRAIARNPAMWECKFL
jgi:hypothetical protein